MIVPIILFSLFICGGIIFCVKNFKKTEKPTNSGDGITSNSGGYQEPVQNPIIKDDVIKDQKLPIHKVEQELIKDENLLVK
jgi:hypothetical protein